MAEAMINSKDYTLLKDFRMEIEIKGGNFIFSFWIYLINSAATFPAIIINQILMDGTRSAPFLFLLEKKIMMLLPLPLICKEPPDPAYVASLAEAPRASMENDFPLEKWIHVGCEVSTDVLCLHVNGEIVGECPLPSPLNRDSISNSLGKITLVGAHENEGLLGYVYNADVLPLGLSIKDHYLKDPPLQLSIDDSSTAEIEEETDGIWSIVGGKASCRRIFSLDVVLSNVFCHYINNEVEVAALLLYADNGLPVEKTSDDEAPLLISYDGIEFPSFDRPSKLLHGRASFKLKISQLSSKCDNRLFRIKFELPELGEYHFLQTFSHPIRCISRSRNPRTSSLTWKRLTLASYTNGSQSLGLDNGSMEFKSNSFQETKPSPLTKRVKLGKENSYAVEPLDEECNSHAWTSNQVEDAFRIKSDGSPDNPEEVDHAASDSESTGGKDLDFIVMPSSGYSISDLNIFKYCLGGLTDRALILKEVAASASEEDLLRFAHEVSVYSGCSHHRRQIMVAKRLIAEGTKVWNSISQNNSAVHWENVFFEIEEQFLKIACCNNRSLAEQDFEVLRRISGCREYITQENFEKMWCWLYPVAFTLSRAWINSMWNSTSPKWIEGFITKEEAELSLQGPGGLQERGTFILRFPTSRSWPHPDAGSLIVTYVGTDHTVHHRLLSLDYIYSCKESQTNMRPIQDMLLEEPELSRLGRTIRGQ